MYVAILAQVLALFAITLTSTIKNSCNKDSGMLTAGAASSDWLVLVGGRWNFVGVAESRFLDQLVRKGLNEGTITLRNYRYHFNIANMTVKNLKTGKVRKLQHCSRPNAANLSYKLDDDRHTNAHVKVTLHVYDVFSHPLVQTANDILHVMGSGAYHAAVEIHGLEWSYGGSDGVFCCEPAGCKMHSYREALPLGEVQLSREQVEDILDMMSEEWEQEDYDLLRKNCCHFSNEFVNRLGLGPIPSWVMNLASAGAAFEDGYIKFRGNEK